MSSTPRKHARFHLRTLEDLQTELGRLGLALPVSGDLSPLLAPLPVSGRIMPNRFAVHPMEGFDSTADGGPGELSFRRYTRYAAGGYGLIWVEATAVLNEGRSNPGQLYLHAGNVGAFRNLVDAMRRTARERFGHAIVVVIQLTHSGRYSKPAGVPAPIIAHHSPILDPKHNLPANYPLVTDDYLDRLQDTYVSAARLAAEAGFDGIDIKSCHRYLVSELLASFTRPGRYGGSFENRTRLLREVLRRVAAEVPGVFITTRMNAYDAIPHPYGFGVDVSDSNIPDLREPLELAAAIRQAGAPMLNVSIGNPYYNPHYGRPFDFPIAGMNPPEEHPLRGIERFVQVTGTIQKANPTLPVLASGYSWLRHLMPYVAAGVLRDGLATILGIGRGSFAYPDAPADLIAGRGMDPAKCCVACSACTQIMRDGGRTGCVVRDSDIYGPQYRRARRFALDRLVAEAERCRDCEEPTCRKGCPARINVPAFVRAFARQDIPAAYETLRQSNALPEMCAFVCPSEVQCEGSCVEEIFCRHPIPIRDIQLVTCQIARRMGLAGVKMASHPSGKRVAVVGGGPAGVAAAVSLLEDGHEVRIIEKSSRLGGTPHYVIPRDRYDDSRPEVEAVLEPALRVGRLTVSYGTAFGTDVSLPQLLAEYDAVVLALGLGRSSSLGQANGVVDALAFLGQAKSGQAGDVPERVAVLGAGNTAADAAVTAKSLGARDVYLLYRRSFTEMPAWPQEIQHMLDAGTHLMILTQPIGYETDDAGRLTGVRIARTELGAPDTSGRRRPEVVPGTESVLSVGLAIEALGQSVSDELREALPGVEFTRGGLISTRDGSLQTSVDRLYVAGDLVNGGTTAVQGIAEGMRAAREVDALLA